MMFCYSLSSSTLPPRLIPTTHHPPPSPPPLRILQVGRQRGISVVTRAGPSTNTYIFAFVFPLTLLAVTFFTSIRIADKLDQKFLEELAVNQAILEAEAEEEEEEENGDEDDENGDEDDEVSTRASEEEPPAPPVRRRNRPKREVEPSSI